MDLSVVLPTYNERENIVPLLEALMAALSELSELSYELVVVDDNSPDGTAQAVRERFGDDKAVKLIVRTADKGFANSIRDGILASSGEIVAVMDTDFNHPPKDLPTLYGIAKYVDIVVGSRFIFGGGMPSTARYFASYIYNIIMRLLLGTRIDDNLSGFFAMRRDRLIALPFDKIFWGYGDYFFRMLLLSQRAGYRHVEVPVFYEPRPGGEAKTRILGIFTQYTGEVLRLMWLRMQGRW